MCIHDESLMQLNCISKTAERIRRVSAHGKRLHRKGKLPDYHYSHVRLAFTLLHPFPAPRNFFPLAFLDGGFLEEIVHRTCAPPTLVNLGYDPPRLLRSSGRGKIHPLATSISEETRAAARENSRENNDYSLERLALPPDVSE